MIEFILWIELRAHRLEVIEGCVVVKRAIEMMVEDLARATHEVACLSELLHDRGPVREGLAPVALVPINPAGGRAQAGQGGHA